MDETASAEGKARICIGILAVSAGYLLQGLHMAYCVVLGMAGDTSNISLKDGAGAHIGRIACN